MMSQLDASFTQKSSRIIRRIFQKECLCDTDRCNENLVDVCLQTDPDLKGKHKNFTCWEAAAASPKYTFRPNDKYILTLSVSLSFIVSQLLSLRNF